MSSITDDASWGVTVSGLAPGRLVECSVQWTPSDASSGVNTGFGAQKVKTNGTTRFLEDIGALRGGSDRPGTLKAWIREPNTGFDDDPIMLDDGPAVVEFHIP